MYKPNPATTFNDSTGANELVEVSSSMPPTSSIEASSPSPSQQLTTMSIVNDDCLPSTFKVLKTPEIIIIYANFQ